MLFFFAQSAFASLLENPFLLPNHYEGDDPCAEIAAYLHAAHYLSTFKTSNSGKHRSCRLNAELEGLHPFEKHLRANHYYLFGQQISELQSTEEYLLCTKTGYAIATAKISHSKELQLEFNFYADEHQGLAEICFARSNEDYFQKYTLNDESLKYIHPNYHDCTGWFPDQSNVGVRCLKGEALQTFGQSGFIRNNLTKMPSYPIQCVEDPFNIRSGRPKGCNRLEDDAFYSPEMMESIPDISDPAAYYHEQLKKIGYSGNFVSGLQMGQSIVEQIKLQQLTIANTASHRRHPHTLFYRSRGGNKMDFWMEVSYTIHEQLLPADLVVLEYATPLVEWLISDENPIFTANKLITPQDLFMVALEHSNGDVFEALDRAHTTLEILFRTALRYGETTEKVERRLAKLRSDGFDQGGAWYHFFGAASGAFLNPKEVIMISPHCDKLLCYIPIEKAILYKELNLTNAERSPTHPTHPDYLEGHIGVQGVKLGKHLASQFGSIKIRQPVHQMIWNLVSLNHKKRTRALSVKLRSSTASVETKHSKIMATLKRENLNILVREALLLTNPNAKLP